MSELILIVIPLASRLDPCDLTPQWRGAIAATEGVEVIKPLPSGAFMCAIHSPSMVSYEGHTAPKGLTMSERSISEIAREIKADWSKIGKGVNYAAKPYLEAMMSLNSISDSYGCDTGKSVVLRFLSNAASYRGETAKRLKAELKAMV